MKRLLALASLLLLQACAAALPAAALAVMGREQLRGDDERTKSVDAAAVMARAAGVQRQPVLVALGGSRIAPPPVVKLAVAQTPMPVPAVGGPFVPSVTTSWAAMSSWLAAASTASGVGGAGCGGKPRALVVDIDEGVARDDRWEAAIDARIVAAPGAREAIEAARDVGIAVIFTSDRAAEAAVYTEVALDFAGLGPARVGETLWLRGENQSATERRAAIAERFCVVATAGDGPSDFGTYKHWADEAATLLGAGWFLVPNPIQVEHDDTVTAPAAPVADSEE